MGMCVESSTAAGKRKKRKSARRGRLGGVNGSVVVFRDARLGVTIERVPSGNGGGWGGTCSGGDVRLRLDGKKTWKAGGERCGFREGRCRCLEQCRRSWGSGGEGEGAVMRSGGTEATDIWGYGRRLKKGSGDGCNLGGKVEDGRIL